jgi:hypothetical protein
MSIPLFTQDNTNGFTDEQIKQLNDALILLCELKGVPQDDDGACKDTVKKYSDAISDAWLEDNTLNTAHELAKRAHMALSGKDTLHLKIRAYGEKLKILKGRFGKILCEVCGAKEDIDHFDFACDEAKSHITDLIDELILSSETVTCKDCFYEQRGWVVTGVKIDDYGDYHNKDKFCRTRAQAFSERADFYKDGCDKVFMELNRF